MICKLYECNNETQNYPFCSGTHNYIFKNRQAEKDDWFDADKMIIQQAWYNKTQLEGNQPNRALYSIEEVELLNGI